MHRAYDCGMPTQSLLESDLACLTINRLAARDAAPIRVTSPAFADGAAIPFEHSAYDQSKNPAIEFANLPADALSLVLLLEDPDAVSRKPFIHWVLINLPPNTPFVHAAVPNEPALPDLGHAQQGKNSTGSTGYFGMKPPAGHQPHHYHFSVFALDQVLFFDTNQPIERDAVVTQMDGHVLAKGDLIGRFAKPD
jgi:Raf kinase inhibitor-like YbhB/YbcL family protein